DFLAALGPDDVAPAAGPVTALVALLATRLAELTARLAGEEELVAEARRLGAEIAPLARLDAEAYEEFLATRAPDARERTIELPARLAELAAETAEAAAAAADRGKTSSRADAAVGALLGEAAAKAAALLVAVNA